MDMQKKKRLMAGLLLLTSVIWGAAFAVQSAGAQKLEAHSFNGIRLLLAGLALLPIILIRGVRAKNRGAWEAFSFSLKKSLIGGLLCGVLLLIATFTQQAALKTSTAGKAGFLTALYIVLVPVFGSFLGRKPEKKIWFCVLLDMLGFYFLCIHGTFTVASGDILLLMTAISFAVQILVVESYLARGADGLMLAMAEFFVAGLIELPFMLLTESPTMAAVISALPELLYVGIFSGAVGFSLQNIGQKYIESAAAALLMSPESVFSAIFGWILLSEKLSGRELLGCACVFAAVLLSQLPVEKLFARNKA